jgi:hypothetical protein
MSGGFELAVDTVFEVPHGFVHEDSLSKKKKYNPKTPKILRAEKVCKRSKKLFRIRTVNDESLRRSANGGKVIFVPSGIFPGARLKITKVEKTCASACLAQ